MTQLFHRSTNTLARVTLFGAVFLVAGIGWGVSALLTSPYASGVGVPVEQPVPFSHKHHVADVGLDCRYCHTSVERSSFAGIPPTKTCMNCHAQLFTDAPMLEPVRASYRTGKPIPWARVHTLADFVYFDHSIHVKQGIGCSTCHGRVDQMALIWRVNTLFMEWCLECHRHPERFVRPRSEVFNMAWEPPADQAVVGAKLVTEYKIQTQTSCSICHR
ncbi:MAG TPA: cytochrome c3 family protein [Candidatus Baltobacteraceae bacterium]|nr:cytochrome c3 family protein [Candidatus Baltobacteraceae bacterium]